MKNNIIARSLIKTLLYMAIALSLYLLYSPANDHPNNQAGSSTQFIYQQF